MRVVLAGGGGFADSHVVEGHATQGSSVAVYLKARNALAMAATGPRQRVLNLVHLVEE